MDDFINNSLCNPISLSQSNNMICVVHYEYLKNKIKVPDIQRDVSEEWVNELYKQQIEHYDKYNFVNIGIIDIGVINDCDLLYLLNGQHRFKVLDLLCNDYNLHNINVYCNIHFVNDYAELNNKWIVLNHSRPVQIYNDSSINLIMNNIKKYLKNNYKKYLSESDKNHLSKMNLDKLELEINKIGLISLLKDHTIFINLFEYINNHLLNLTIIEWNNMLDSNNIEIVQKTKLKNIHKPLLLGLYKNFEWLYVLKSMIQNDIKTINKMPKMCYKRKSIPNRLRIQVWNKRNDKNSTNGVCYVCNECISMHDFECAHVISTHFNGETILNNLEPTCRLCNNDMNIMNLEDYKSIHYQSI